jgi:hypothetical protein
MNMNTQREERTEKNERGFNCIGIAAVVLAALTRPCDGDSPTPAYEAATNHRVPPRAFGPLVAGSR